MLLAARLSAVLKKPRLRITMRRSSSVKPFGLFHRAMSADMLISCGIQWLAQPARYFSHAHLYLNGTSWFTSVAPLITRLSEARTRVAAGAGSAAGADGIGAAAGMRGASCGAGVKSSSKFSIVHISFGSCNHGGWPPTFLSVATFFRLRACPSTSSGRTDQPVL